MSKYLEREDTVANRHYNAMWELQKGRRYEGSGLGYSRVQAQEPHNFEPLRERINEAIEDINYFSRIGNNSDEIHNHRIARNLVSIRKIFSPRLTQAEIARLENDTERLIQSIRRPTEEQIRHFQDWERSWIEPTYTQAISTSSVYPEVILGRQSSSRDLSNLREASIVPVVYAEREDNY
jgi:hypothetical protein